jgi:hypothetical protein
VVVFLVMVVLIFLVVVVVVVVVFVVIFVVALSVVLLVVHGDGRGEHQSGAACAVSAIERAAMTTNRRIA